MMETSFAIYRIQPYLRNPSSRLIKSPKIYFSDTGLAYFLTGIKGPAMNGFFRGMMWESYVAQNLAGILSAGHPGIRVSYWSVQGRYEADFVLEVGNETVIIEVKCGSRWEDKDLLGLKAFLASSGNCQAAILAYNGSETVKLEDKIWVIPVSTMLS